MMDWLPAPLNFRGELGGAREAREPMERLKRLAALAQHRLGFLETIQLDRALGPIPPDAIDGFTHVRLAILAASTVDHLVPGIRVAGLRRRLLIDVYLGPFGQYRQELLQPDSGLRRFAPGIILFSLAAQGAIAGIPLTASAAEVESSLGLPIDELRTLWRKAREELNASVIQQTFLNVADPLFGSHDRLVPGAPTRLIAALNDKLAAAAAADAVPLLDITRASERDGLGAWFDTTRWLQGKQDIAPQAAPGYGELAVRIIGAQRGLSRKCLVLDLDNTLWGGVVGDDGLEGIVLGEGSAAGEAHLALQRYARQLRERGVILAVCSKNDPAIAEAVFRDHPEMLLKRADIAAFVANWEDKAANLRTIAELLNIGLDSLVFVDDNPAERARIRQSLPMVAVPELPANAGDYVRCLADAGYFEAIAFTTEDQQRGEQYAANASREAALRSSESMDDFLRGLDMKLVFGPITAVDLARSTQLINKTNQFNLTTRRYSQDEVGRFATSPCDITLQFRLEDKFGDNGLVSVMIVRAVPGAADELEIDTWVMSCRVFGRQLEWEAMNIAVEAARRLGARTLRAQYIPTPKNAVVGGLYPSLGFDSDPDSGAAGETTRWRLDLATYVSRATHIRRPD
jgi:FkbH-like protein